MRNFILGVITGIAAVAIAAFASILFNFTDRRRERIVPAPGG